MGGGFSQEISIDRVDMKTKFKIRDYLAALNLDYKEMRENDVDTVITIDVSPIVNRKQVLHDLLVFLQNEKFKTEVKSERKQRQKIWKKAAANNPMWSGSDISTESRPRTTLPAISEEDIENLMGVSSDGLELETDEEDSVLLFAHRSISDITTAEAQMPPTIEDSSELLLEEVILPPPRESPPPQPRRPPSPILLGSSSVFPEAPSSVLSADKPSKKGRGKRFIQLFTSCVKRNKSQEEVGTELAPRLSPEEDQLLRDLVAGPGPMIPPQHLQVCHFRTSSKTRSGDTSTSDASTSETTSESGTSSTGKSGGSSSLYREPDACFEGTIKYVHDQCPCQKSKKKCKSWCCSKKPKKDKSSAGELKKADGNYESLRTELMKQRNELAELKSVIHSCFKKLNSTSKP